MSEIPCHMSKVPCMGRFKESNGFVLTPASWWPDEGIGGQCAYWVMIPT